MKGTPLYQYVRERALAHRAGAGAPCPVLVCERSAEEPEENLLMTQVGAPARLEGKNGVRVFELKKGAGKAFPLGVTVGRVENNDVVLDERSVSRFHAYFVRGKEGKWSLVDAGSKLGTWVDGKRLAPSTPVPVQSATRIRFGALDVLFFEGDGLKQYSARQLERGAGP